MLNWVKKVCESEPRFSFSSQVWFLVLTVEACDTDRSPPLSEWCILFFFYTWDTCSKRTVISPPRTFDFLTVGRLREVHVSVSQGAPGDHVPAYPNGEHRSGGAEFLVQHSLRDVGVQVANVERSHRITPRRCVHISHLTEVNAKLPLKINVKAEWREGEGRKMPVYEPYPGSKLRSASRLIKTLTAGCVVELRGEKKSKLEK